MKKSNVLIAGIATVGLSISTAFATSAYNGKQYAEQVINCFNAQQVSDDVHEQRVLQSKESDWTTATLDNFAKIIASSKNESLACRGLEV